MPDDAKVNQNGTDAGAGQNPGSDKGNQPEAGSQQGQPDSTSSTTWKGGDWYDIKNHDTSKLTPESVESFKAMLADQKRVFEEKTQKLSASAKKFAFNSLDELKDLAENNSDFRALLVETQKRQEDASKALEDSNEAVQFLRSNWDKLSESEKSSYLQNLTGEQKIALESALFMDSQRIAAQKVKTEQMDKECLEKFGDDYKEVQTDLIDKFKNVFQKNAREAAFKTIFFEKYGEKMYQKGLSEKAKNVSGAANISGSGSRSSATDKFEGTAEDALSQALSELNIDNIEALALR